MTAEIAILNKSAVALAADSAVTISMGRQEQKIYDTADKLFDLCADSPIGIMIFNGMQFMQAPLPMLIADYRHQCHSFSRVPEAGADFLKFLCAWGRQSPPNVAAESVYGMVVPVFDIVRDRVSTKLQRLVENAEHGSQDGSDGNVSERLQSIISETIDVVLASFAKRERALFLGPDGKLGAPAIEGDDLDLLRQIATEYFPAGTKNVEKLTELAKEAVLGATLSGGETGIVFAGFGHDDTFPTLISYEVDGMAFGMLKYVENPVVDIDRKGPRAKVLPFAQKEMVERFLYGLDEDIEHDINTFCRKTVPAISGLIIDRLELDDSDRAELIQQAEQAQDAFIDGLANDGFAKIRSQSKTEIEDMVEFMPKPELATMAEALVNLTSLKRRVSRGMETVGGPIDVAVISRSEGFIWVKRKHYFPAELNPRYFHRVNANNRERNDGQK